MTDPLPPGRGIRAFPGEPVAPFWREQTWPALAAELLAVEVGARPVIVAVDGRSGAGKSTVADRLRDEVPGSCVVHTDDVAWHESFFGWDGLLAAGVLLPVRQGGAVAFRPPAWLERGREGAIEVPAGCPLLIVEGVGAGRASLTPLVDVAIWVQSDRQEARRRGLERDGGTPEAITFWEEWQAGEVPFLAADRPWDRADIVLCGTPGVVRAGASSDPVGDRVLRGVHPSPLDEPVSCRC